MIIYHISDPMSWETGMQDGDFHAQTLHVEGFIHCCTKSQVDFVLENWFKGADNLILVSLESEKLRSKLIFENSEGGEELFPHIYGPINSDAVVGVEPIKKDNK